ncbi:MAG: helix-hairpin-helix domain-containing protein [Planctomycetes bacterium]|nr:helix-hairpin-helix domain-containing protein [Planctomycetota bacterium]
MWILTKQEKLILIFLVASLAVGLGVRCFQQLRKGVKLEVVSGALTLENQGLDKTIKEKKVVKLNRAGLEELTALPGIGPALAQRILSYRQEKGPFKDKSEIQNVPGIGPKKFSEIEPFLSLE